MVPLLKLLIPLAMSSPGRKLIRRLVGLLRSEEGRRTLARARRAAAGPEARARAVQLARLLRRASQPAG